MKADKIDAIWSIGYSKKCFSLFSRRTYPRNNWQIEARLFL